MDLQIEDDFEDMISKEVITISKQQRNGRKCWTFIEGFAKTLESNDDVKKFIKLVKKSMCCNGSYKQDTMIIQFQGDCVECIMGILKDKYDYNTDDIIIKGA